MSDMLKKFMDVERDLKTADRMLAVAETTDDVLYWTYQKLNALKERKRLKYVR